MELNDHSLRQMDEDDIRNLPEAALRDLAVRLLIDLKAARERLNQNSQNSSRPPGSDAPWVKIGEENDGDDNEDAEWGEDVGVSVDGEDADRAGTERPDADERSDDTSGEADNQTVKRKPGKQPGAPGFGRQQQLPVTACVDHRATSCGCCGKGLEEAASTSRAYTGFYTLDIEWGNPEAPGLVVTNTRHLYYETLCHCGHLTREAPGSPPPDALLPGVALSEWRLVGPGLSALIVCLTYRLRLSRERIVEFLWDWLGLRLSVGTVHNALMESGRAAMALEKPLANAIRDDANDDVLHIDETAWKERTTLLWLWVFTTRTTVVFWIASRSSEILDNVLGGDWNGWLMSDGYKAYRQFLKRCRCWAHLLRKARGLEECLNGQAQRFGRQTVDLLDTLIAAIKTARDDPPDKQLSQLYHNLLQNYRRECERMRECTHEKARALAVEMLNDWEAIFRVLDHPHLPLTNNEAERALRHWVILRRICYGTKTAEGSRVFAILASVIETCRKRQRSPWLYLQDVIANRRAGLPALPLPAVGGSE